MKKLLTLLFILVTMTANAQWNKNSVKVDKEARGYWMALTHLYEQKGIKIDYKKIKYVKVVDRDDVGWVGLHDPSIRTIYLNKHKYESIKGIKHSTMMILILAHELAHSQGIDHSYDRSSIMYTSTRYIREMLNNNVRVTDLALTPYISLNYKFVN